MARQSVALVLALALPARALAEEAAPASRAATEQDQPAPPSAAKLTEKPLAEDEPEVDVLTFHRANYMVSGFTKETQVKFQFSFKFDLWPSASRHTVYLAYTQKSLWDLYDTSAPFRESNYAPEIFYAHYHSDVRGQPNPGCGFFSERAGFEHESNGEAGDASRSWNKVFVDVQATCYGKPLYGLLGVRAWYPIGLRENPTIKRTQGYGELLLGVGLDEEDAHSNGLVTVTLRKGTSRELAKGSLTVDARWRPTYRRLIGKSWKFAPYLWFQLFTGYGETLGTHDIATTGARLGIGFTDRAR